MYQNDKLKLTFTLAFSLMALGFQHPSFALGLSDIEVRSHLGQPLKAKLNVLGANALKDNACLRLGPNSDLSHAHFLLGPLSGDVAKLTVTSNKLINEPIVNLSIIAGCDSTVKRDYVLLIDPPLSNLSNHIESSVVVQKTDTSAINSTAELTEQTQTIQEPTAAPKKKQRSSRKKTNAKKRQKPQTITKKSHRVTQVYLESTSENNPVNNKARLSISGGNNAILANTVRLRLERHLRFTPDANAPVINDNIEIEDEITVMNNRLKHLQEQITGLQAQNSQLALDNQLKTEQLTQATSWQPKLSGILPFIGTLLLLVGGYIGFHWLRRRHNQKQNHYAEAIWVNTKEQEDNANTSEPESVKEEDIFNDVNFGIKDSMDDKLPAPSMEDTFESTKADGQQIVLEDEQPLSVLDHADVFLSHGRTTLAIQLLQNHLLEHPKQSVTIWLFLLDLVEKENLQTLYEETAIDCKLHFNVKTADFSASESTTNESSGENSLEDFPRLAKGLEEIWNTPASIVYLDDLIYNNRLEPRAGLPKNLIEELVLLKSMAQENTSSAEVIQLDKKKLAIIEEKEAMLESKKADKLKAMSDAEKLTKEKAKEDAEAEANDTDFEFTLVER
ncbi:MAG: FimV family protein [Methylophilaceae bacterium]